MSMTSAKQTAHYTTAQASGGIQVIPNLAAAGRKDGKLHMVLVTPGSANATAVITNGIVAAGAVQLANVSAQTPWSNGFDMDTDFTGGLWLVVTGTGADVTVTWE